MILIKNNFFSFNERKKTFCSVNCSLVQTILILQGRKRSCSENQTRTAQAIQDFCSVKFLLYQGFAHKTREKYYHSHSKEDSQVKEKKFSTRKKFSTLKKVLNSGGNSQLKGKFLTLEKIFNSGENSRHRKRKFPTQKNKIFYPNLAENSQLRIKFSTQKTKYYNH